MTDESIQTELFADFFKKKLPLPNESPDKKNSGEPVTIHYSKRLKKSIRFQKLGGKFQHKMLENAPHFLKKLFDYEQPSVSYKLTLPEYMSAPEFSPVRELAKECAALSFKRKTPGIKARLKECHSRIWQLTDQILLDLGKNPIRTYPKLPPIQPVGNYYNLNDIFEALNATYFNGELKARITWSNRIGGLSFHTKRTDPLTGDEIDLISISRGYDFKNCPFYAVAGVVYHECLHIAIPPVVVKGKRIVHGKNFKQRERRYIYYEQWIKWHREILPQNIWTLRKRAREKR